MIRPWVMSDPVINKLVRISGTFATELPYCPILAVFRIEECDETIERITVGALRVGLRRAGSVDAITSEFTYQLLIYRNT